MDYIQLTSPCGIDCFNCEIFEKNVTPELQNRLGSIFGKKPEEITCRGCRVSGCLFIPYPCPTKVCVESKGVDFCCDCDEFPCDKLHPCADRADALPHNLKLFNLCRIKAVGLENWAKETKAIRRKYFKGKMMIGKGPQEADS